MADGSTLGDLTINVGLDAATLASAMGLAQKKGTADAKKLGDAVEKSIKHSFELAKKSIESSFNALKAGGKVGDGALITLKKRIIEVQQAVEKQRGSWQNATEEEKKGLAELEAQLKKLREATKPIAPPKVVTESSPDFVGPKNPFTELEAKQKKAIEVADDFKKKYAETGEATFGDIKKMVAAHELLGDEIKKTTARVGSVPDAATKAYDDMGASIDDANRKVVKLTEKLNDQRETLNKYGGEWNGLGDAVEKVLGKHGIKVGKGAMALAAFKEGWGIGSGINSFFGGADDSGIKQLSKDVQRVTKPFMKRLGSALSIQWELIAATFDGTKYADVMRGHMIDGKSLLKPMQSNAWNFRMADYDRRENPRLPLLPRLQFQADRALAERDRYAASRNTITGWDNFREADTKYVEAKNAIESFMDSNEQRIAQLDLEHASMTNNKKDIENISLELENLTNKELKRAGVSEHNIAVTMDATKRNRELTFSLRDLNEAIEDKSLAMTVAQGDFEFGQQRKLNAEIGERSLRVAELTGRSDEYIASLTKQIEQQRIQIDIAEIQRRQETVDLQTQAAQGYGNLDLQKKLAAESNKNAIAIALKEKRSRSYIQALKDLGIIEQKLLDMDRVQRRIDATSMQLEIAQMKDEISGANAYGVAIEDLTAKIAALNIERLKASPNPFERNILAPLLQRKEDLRPDLQRLTYKRELQAIDRDIAAQHRSIQSESRQQELYANEQAILSYRSMVTQNVITKEQGDALIARSHELLMERLRDIDASYGKDWGRWIERMVIKYNDEADRIGDALERIADNGKNALVDGMIASLTEGLDGLKGAFKSFGDAVLREILNIVASKAMAQLLSAFGGVFTRSSALPAYSNSLGNLVSSANGNVLRGGFKAFAMGGVVKRPTLGLIGEGRYNEAVVPLPDGRSIPVEMNGGRNAQRTPITVEVVWGRDIIGGIVDAAAAAGESRAARMVVPIAIEDIMKNGPLRKVIQASV